jgi:N-acetylglucosaminyl-diphospho-decaprenol L-rhamnosyltransferase
VVDNASGPTARAQLRELAEHAPVPIEVVELESNRGFGPAANVGLSRWLDGGRGEWVGLAPHDAQPEPATLRVLIEAAEARPRAGLACADVGAGEMPVFDPYFGGMTVAGPGGSGWLPVDYPHGTLLVARRACLDEVGLFDERYFAYCEETDLGLRARFLGWEVGLVRGALVHNPSMRSGRAVIEYLMNRNTLMLVREHSGRYHAAVRLMLGAGQLAIGMLPGTTHRFDFSARGRLWGMADFVRGRSGPPPRELFVDAGRPSTPTVGA